MTHDPKTLILAFASGIIPSLLWLWFWLNEDSKQDEPRGLVTAIFILGMISVIFVLPVEKFIQLNIDSKTLQIVFWAMTEELAKFIAVMLAVYHTSFSDEPIEWPIHMITAALGFAALENSLFLLRPFAAGATAVGLLTGQLRFLGATLLHTVSSGILGISLAVSLDDEEGGRTKYIFGGLVLAVALHSVFNFFIIKDNGNDFLRVFAFLWVVTIIIMLLLERVRRISNLT